MLHIVRKPTHEPPHPGRACRLIRFCDRAILLLRLDVIGPLVDSCRDFHLEVRVPVGLPGLLAGACEVEEHVQVVEAGVHVAQLMAPL